MKGEVAFSKSGGDKKQIESPRGYSVVRTDPEKVSITQMFVSWSSEK